jgi:competence protein ComEA
MTTPPPTPSPLPPPDSSPLAAWPRSAQLTTAFLLGVVITLLGVQVISGLRFGTRPTEVERAPYRVDLNRASRAELMQLPGVGEATVNRLEDYRREHDGFRSVEELTQVHGIGPTTLERLRPWIFVSDEATDATPRASKTSGERKPGKKETALKSPIDVNRASAEELQRLPGVGVKMAQRILDERRKKPFQSPADLRRVAGIGPKTLEKLKPYVVMGPPAESVVAETID